MKVTQTKTTGTFNGSYRKGNFDGSFIVVSPQLEEIITIRIYRSSGVVVKAAMWVHNNPLVTVKEHNASWSGIVSKLLTEAGYLFDFDLEDWGINKAETALLLIADLKGYPGSKVFKIQR